MTFYVQYFTFNCDFLDLGLLHTDEQEHEYTCMKSGSICEMTL